MVLPPLSASTEDGDRVNGLIFLSMEAYEILGYTLANLALKATTREEEQGPLTTNILDMKTIWSVTFHFQKRERNYCN
jgi:hypothetical protein